MALIFSGIKWDFRHLIMFHSLDGGALLCITNRYYTKVDMTCSQCIRSPGFPAILPEQQLGCFKMCWGALIMKPSSFYLHLSLPAPRDYFEECYGLHNILFIPLPHSPSLSFPFHPSYVMFFPSLHQKQQMVWGALLSLQWSLGRRPSRQRVFFI